MAINFWDYVSPEAWHEYRVNAHVWNLQVIVEVGIANSQSATVKCSRQAA